MPLQGSDLRGVAEIHSRVFDIIVQINISYNIVNEAASLLRYICEIAHGIFHSFGGLLCVLNDPYQ